MKKVKKMDILTIGFALFAMFFGAGNVIFPPYLGLQSGKAWVGGFAAYYIADVLLALVAFFALLREGNAERLMDRLGKKAATVLMTIIVLCIGPMLAIPRTSATTFEMSIYPLIPRFSPILFSVIFFAVILALCIKKSSVIDVIGKFLTPALLLGLLVLIIVGMVKPIGHISPIIQVDSVAIAGAQAGYQTMDVLAAIVFGAVLISTAAGKGYEDEGSRGKVLIGSAIVGGVLLLIVYLGLTYLGATVSEIYPPDIARADLVIAIVEALLGKPGLIIFAVVVGLACVTTATALVCSAADHFAGLTKGKVSYQIFVVIICVFSAVVSNLGLDRIISVAAPILNVVYPPVLVLVVVSLIAPHMPNAICISAVVGALITSVLTTISSTFGISMPWLNYLPLSGLDLGWVLPAVVFGFGGFIFRLPWLEREKAEDDELEGE